MARARRRMIDPALWLNADLGALSMAHRLLYIGTISLADDDGRVKADPRVLKAQVFPYDDLTAADVDGMIAALDAAGLVRRYLADGVAVLYHPHWTRYQQISPTKYHASDLPPPPGAEPPPGADPRRTAPDGADRRHSAAQEKVIEEKRREVPPLPPGGGAIADDGTGTAEDLELVNWWNTAFPRTASGGRHTAGILDQSAAGQLRGMGHTVDQIKALATWAHRKGKLRMWPRLRDWIRHTRDGAGPLAVDQLLMDYEADAHREDAPDESLGDRARRDLLALRRKAKPEGVPA